MTKSKTETDFGKPLEYDRDFDGPRKGRSCTDIICFCIFFVFIGCWIGIGIYAFVNGDPNTLLVPRDSRGRRCGLDPDVQNKPYLLFFDLTKCLGPQVPFLGCDTPQVCVEKCPEETKRDVSSNDKFCIPPNEPKILGQRCPKWYIESKPIRKRCIPTISSNTINQIENLTENKLIEAVRNIKIISQSEEVVQDVVDDIIVSWWKILIGIILAIFVCLIYIVILRWIAAFMVWLSIIGVLVLLIFATYFSATKFLEFKKKMEDDDLNTSHLESQKYLWLTALIISSILLLIVLLMLIFLRKRIILAIALIREGSKAVSSVTSVLVFPCFPWILQIGVIVYAISVALFLTTTGKPIYRAKNTSGCPLKENDVCHPENITNICETAKCKFISMENPMVYPYLQTINVFGFFWGVFFVSALGQMILAVVFAQWYWTRNKSKLPFFAVTSAMFTVLRYHVGTLAFGSLIITICRIIRVCLEYLDRKLKEYDNAFTSAIMCCLKCFFWCLEKFLKFINKNAYIMCAIHGKNFCTSAKDAFMLLMRNIIRVVVLDKVTDFLFFLSKLVVTVGVGSITYIMFATDYTAIDNSDMKYNFVPVIVIMIFTYLITSVFFNVYSMAVDTLFLCFLEDCERNDGSASKPYAMSKNLMKIFGKRNKRE